MVGPPRASLENKRRPRIAKSCVGGLASREQVHEGMLRPIGIAGLLDHIAFPQVIETWSASALLIRSTGVGSSVEIPARVLRPQALCASLIPAFPLHACTYTRTRIHPSVRPCMHASVHTCIYTYTACIHIYIQLYIYVYIHITILIKRRRRIIHTL